MPDVLKALIKFLSLFPHGCEGDDCPKSNVIVDPIRILSELGGVLFN
jgi:hypothetical protein